MEFSAVIVNYDSREPLAGCLDALEAAAAGHSHETLVVDNSPGDGTAQWLRERHPSVRILANRDNLGFARAVNQGLEATTTPFALVLNPDCELERDALDALLAHHAANPRCGIAAPRIHNPDGTLEYSARSYPGPLTVLFNRYSLLTRLFPRNPWSRGYLLTDWDHASVRDVDWVSGACMLVRREAIAQVGPFDEGFFMFNEDVDWCRRMNLAGWRVTYVSSARAVHHVGASRHRVSNKVIWERHRGMLRYFRKHHRPNPISSGLVALFVMSRASLMVALNGMKPR
ncbi:MAG: glycosyltransferase family 2 protein [Candidatus Eisenbacteria bacterium]|uniref:Glycosyltransferase family 2 protein n=1 Tax=Eiseniibacteriota bacterium TaxID=2212470 RepID=A0A849T186_UNCEI|nr:glycosyltransferase family 2 protein [Candidatus Eisenbacteria bacterium]